MQPTSKKYTAIVGQQSYLLNANHHMGNYVAVCRSRDEIMLNIQGQGGQAALMLTREQALALHWQLLRLASPIPAQPQGGRHHG